MLDVIRPTTGTICVLGLDAQRDTMALHQHIGYLPGDVRLPGDMTGKQVINYFSRLQGREPVLLDELVARFDVEMKRPAEGVLERDAPENRHRACLHVQSRRADS